MKNVYVVRHTEATHHVQGLVGGWYDTSLTENGRNQARKTALALYSEIGEQNIPIYSSDLKRCVETAEVIAEVFNSTVIPDRNLREMSWGDAEGKNQEWWDKNITPRPADGNRLDHQIFRNAESRRDVGTRIQSSVDRIASRPDNNIIIVTHGFALTFVFMAWLRIPVENMDYCTFSTKPRGVTLLHEDDFFENRFVMYINKPD
ncbi:MAG TPA: histidine phosphatase family protein [Dehalococcoidia bacterium]|nr:histidine phosphatase family protein [Dehalococcoidia bacterium]